MVDTEVTAVTVAMADMVATGDMEVNTFRILGVSN